MGNEALLMPFQGEFRSCMCFFCPVYGLVFGVGVQCSGVMKLTQDIAHDAAEADGRVLSPDLSLAEEGCCGSCLPR